jgi:hypothetical protein
MDEDMETLTDNETWTRTWKHGLGHGSMDEVIEAWTRTLKYGRGMVTWTRTWRHGQGHETLELWKHGHMVIETWT